LYKLSAEFKKKKIVRAHGGGMSTQVSAVDELPPQCANSDSGGAVSPGNSVEQIQTEQSANATLLVVRAAHSLAAAHTPTQVRGEISYRFRVPSR
jgi:hypothetical protein